MRRPALHLLPVALILFGGMTGYAQRSGISIAPPVLYPGVNEITVTSGAGIGSIEANASDNVTFEQVSASQDGTTRTFRVVVYGGNQPALLQLSVRDVDGRKATRRLHMGVHWMLDRINLGRVRQGEDRCAEFSVRAVNNNVVERVTTDDSRLKVTLKQPLPYRLDGEYLRYTVCFSGEVEPGIYKFPVTAWIRRDYPTGGESTYPISDTGYVVVVAKDTEGRVDDPTLRTPRSILRSAIPLPAMTNPSLPTPPVEREENPRLGVPPKGPTIGGVVVPSTDLPAGRTTVTTSAARTLD